MSKINKNKRKEILKYLTTGGSTVVLQYIIMIIMVELFNINYLIATSVSILISTTTNYIVQKYWSFHSNVSLGKSSLKYILVFFINYFFTIYFVYISVEKFKFNYILSNTIAVILTAFWTYYLYKYFVYKK